MNYQKQKEEMEDLEALENDLKIIFIAYHAGYIQRLSVPQYLCSAANLFINPSADGYFVIGFPRFLPAIQCFAH